MYSLQTTYTQARQNLASLLDKIENDSAIVLIKRRDHQDVAMIKAEDLESMIETLYLLRSPANAQRLLDALSRSKQRDSAPLPQSDSLDELCEELGIVREEKK